MKLTPGVKILIAVLLLAAAVAAWYTLYLQGTQEAAAPTPPAKQNPAPATSARAMTSPSARALEILPLPFLVTKAPEEAPPPVKEPETPVAEPPLKEEVEAPPNPFLPLPQRLKAMAASSPKPKPKPTPTTSKPVTVKVSEAPELMNVPLPRVLPPAATEPVLPPEASVRLGALPVRLQPLERLVVPVAEGQEQPREAAASGKADKTAGNPLEAWAKAQGLRLSGIALGPVSVAIFATKDGYVALPVGEQFPGTDVQLKAVTAERVLLVQGPHTLTLEYGGGG